MAASDSVPRFFPYDEPYDHQADAIDQIRTALINEQDVLFEGACGTGKTLAALAPALEYGRATGKTVVITTNVHQQTRQFIEEARAINQSDSIQCVVFRGKASMCHIDVGYEECQALRDTARDIEDLETEVADLKSREDELLAASQNGDEEAAQTRASIAGERKTIQSNIKDLKAEKNFCERYYNNLTGDTNAFYEWLYSDVRTPDEIYTRAHEMDLCGYELLKDGIAGIDLCICNFHHLLDPFIREQFFKWLGQDPSDIVVVFDEAHNIAGAARDHATRVLTEQTLTRAVEELADANDARADPAANVIEAFRAALVTTYEDALGFGARDTVSSEWEDITIDTAESRDELTLAFLEEYTGHGITQDIEQALSLGAELDRRYAQAYKNRETSVRRECPTLTATAFIENWLAASDDPGKYPVVGIRQTDTEIIGRVELYTCLPKHVTQPLFEDISSSILMSATLRPFHETEHALGLDEPVTMAYGEQFPESRRRTYAVETPALFASQRTNPDVQETVNQALEDAVRFTPGNTLAYFPNYAEAEGYFHRFSGDATPYLDEPGSRAQELRETFAADDDAVLFTSLWGTLTEGVSFDGDDARTVIVVGVPYPQLDDRLEAIQRAYQRTFAEDHLGDGHDAGWQYAVEIPTIRKTRQAIGRVIRSPTDFGVRLLLDQRYTQSHRTDLGEYSVYPTFPPEEQASLIDIPPENLKFALLNFYDDMNAWEGERPSP